MASARTPRARKNGGSGRRGCWRIKACFHSLWDGVLSSLDLAEELLRDAVVEGKLSIEHGEEDHSQRPHVTGLATVWPTCRQRRHPSMVH